MDEITVETVTDVDLTDTVLIEGLPGVGNVGKLAVNHLLDETDAELVCRVYSEHFPPQVSVDDDGIASLTAMEFHATTLDNQDILLLTGDHQAQSNHGHYRITNAILDIADDYDVSTIYALGGVPTGELIEEYDVLGAATADTMVDELSEYGVEFRDNEPTGGIVGVSGLLLGLGEKRSIDAACLMGETSGYMVDPKSARAVLEILQDALSFEIDYSELEDRAEKMEEVVSRIQEMESQQSAPAPTEDNLRYIG